MSRITREEEQRIVASWMRGNSYAKIREATGRSKSTIHGVITRAKKREPDLDQLRELNVALRKGGSNVLDAIRGSKLLEKINILGVSLEDLQRYVEFGEKISSEKGVEASNFVHYSMEFHNLSRETGRTYHQLVDEFTLMQSKLAGMQRELEAKIREWEAITASFKVVGLDWDEGVKIVGEIRDLREEAKKLRSENAHIRAQLRDEKGRLQKIKTQISSLRGVRAQLDESVANLSQIAQGHRSYWQEASARETLFSRLGYIFNGSRCFKVGYSRRT